MKLGIIIAEGISCGEYGMGLLHALDDEGICINVISAHTDNYIPSLLFKKGYTLNESCELLEKIYLNKGTDNYISILENIINKKDKKDFVLSVWNDKKILSLNDDVHCLFGKKECELLKNENILPLEKKGYVSVEKLIWIATSLGANKLISVCDKDTMKIESKKIIYRLITPYNVDFCNSHAILGYKYAKENIEKILQKIYF